MGRSKPSCFSKWLETIAGKLVRASRIRNFGTRFFCAPNNMFVYTIKHLTFRAPQVGVGTLPCTSPCTYYKDKNILQQKVNLRSIPLTINREPSLGIQTFLQGKVPQKCLLSTQNQTTVFEINDHSWSFSLFVGSRQQGCQ